MYYLKSYSLITLFSVFVVCSFMTIINNNIYLETCNANIYLYFGKLLFLVLCFAVWLIISKLIYFDAVALDVQNGIDTLRTSHIALPSQFEHEEPKKKL